MNTDLEKQVWQFVELVARGNTEMVELERLASNLIEVKYEDEQREYENADKL